MAIERAKIIANLICYLARLAPKFNVYIVILTTTTASLKELTSRRFS